MANDAAVVTIGTKRNRFAVIRDVPLMYPAAAVVLAVLAANYRHRVDVLHVAGAQARVPGSQARSDDRACLGDAREDRMIAGTTSMTA